MSQSDVKVSFGGDTKELRDQLNAARDSVTKATTDMKNGAEAANPAFVKLQESIDRLNESAGKTADASSSLESYAFYAFAMKAAGFAVDTFSASLHLAVSANNAVKTGMTAVQDAVVNTTTSFLNYTKTLAYSAEYLPLLERQNRGFLSTIGQAKIAYDEFFSSADRARAGIVSMTAVVISASGNIDAFAAALRANNFTTVTEGVRVLTDQLSHLKDISPQVSSSIVASFGSIPDISGPLLRSLVDITREMTTTGEQAKTLADTLTAVMSNPQTAGEAFLQNQRDVTAEVMNQFEAYKKVNNVSGMQAVILGEFIQKEKLLFEEKQRAAREQVAAAQALGLSTASEIKALNDATNEMQAQLNALYKLEQQIKATVPGFEESALAAGKIVTQMSTLNDQLATANSNIITLGKGLGNITVGSGLKEATGDAAKLIAQFEGFSAKAYWDKADDPSKSHWAVGYGTHKMSDGSEVTESSTMTRQEAEENLAKRVVEFQDAAAKEIGTAWEGLSANTKASITSVAYNYGHVPQSVQSAAETGSDQLVAKAIAALGSNPVRRQQEAANITGEGLGANAKSVSPAQEEAILKEKQAALDLTNAIAGGNAVAQAQGEILKRNAEGQKDSVKDAQQLVEAWKQDASTAETKIAKIQAQNGLHQAQLALAQKVLEVARSQNALASNEDTTAKEKLASAQKAADLELKAAGDDVALQNAALLKKKMAQDAYDQAVKASAVEAENSSFALANTAFEARKARLVQEVQAHSMSNQQKLDADLALSAEQTALEAKHFKTLRDLEDVDTLGYQQYQDKITLITAQASAKREQIIAQDNRKIQQSYDQIANQMSSSITSGIMGMIQGTTSLRQFMQNMALQITQMFVKAGVDMVVHWAEQQLMMTLHTVTSQTAQSAAVAAGTAVKLATVTAGATAGAAVERAGHMTTISGDASTAAAGAYASVVQIPIIGPILAPAAAAVAFGAVEAFGSFDVGSYRVPNDQLAMIHKDEMVIPSRGGVADQFRSMLNDNSSGFGSGGGSESHYHFHGAVMDPKSIAKIVATHFDANPSSRPRY